MTIERLASEFERLRPKLVNWLRRNRASYDEAEDVVSQAFLHCCRYVEKLEDGPLDGVVFRTVGQRWIEQLRKKHRDDVTIEGFDHGKDPDESALDRVELEEIRCRAYRLKYHHRQIVFAMIECGGDQQLAIKKLGIEPSTFRSRMHKMRREWEALA